MHFGKYSFGMAVVCLTILASPPATRATDVSGVVRDSVTGSPIPNVTVFIVETGDSTISDGSGAFFLPGITLTNYTLMAGTQNYSPLMLFLPSAANCCIGRAGNVDGDPSDIVDIADLTLLIDNLFISFPPLPCPAEANIDGDPGGLVDIADLTMLIDALFISFPLPAVCQ